MYLIEILKVEIRGKDGMDVLQIQCRQTNETGKVKMNFIHPLLFYHLSVVKFSKQAYRVTQPPTEEARAFPFRLMESLSCF